MTDEHDIWTIPSKKYPYLSYNIEALIQSF